uniref:Uncharacterized protein n=1 Tax=Tanacetum cinerariifolium TaxID=118510 RepID=A0A6L2LMC2_TANCI|nr:hypothetical protein [Tanacetum cinerariifolium]
MNLIATQQIALDNALVALKNRVKIRICNMRIDPTKTPNESTYQVVLDALALSPLYLAFLIIAKVPKIYMQQFCHTITKIKESSSYKFKLDKKKCTIDVEVFRDILHIYPRLPTKSLLYLLLLIQKLSLLSRNLAIEEPAEKPAKNPSTRRQSTGVQTRDTIGVFVLKKKAPTKAERSKGIELLSEAALHEEAHNDEENVSDNPRTSDDEEEIQEDEFVHTPENYVPTDDENVDGEEYERINKEMYDDVNVELKDAEPADEGKCDEEMTDAEKGDAEIENVNQEVTGNQVNDDAQATVTAALATQKTKVPLQSSSISSDYATKFLNFDNIPSADTEIISMMDIKVQHEDPSCQTSPFLTVPVLVILESLKALVTTIPLHIPPFIPLPQKSTPIPTPTTTEATISTTSALDSSTLIAIHQRLFDLENETMTSSKTFNKHPKHTALYHSLMESILANEDAINKGFASIQKKRKPDDADRDEDHPTGPDQGFKRRKTGKETKSSKKAKSTGTSKSTTKS